jgi:hypothetical protein
VVASSCELQKPSLEYRPATAVPRTEVEKRTRRDTKVRTRTSWVRTYTAGRSPECQMPRAGTFRFVTVTKHGVSPAEICTDRGDVPGHHRHNASLHRPPRPGDSVADTPNGIMSG